MILSLLVIAVIALVGYLWMHQGLFSALLHFACTVVAGAVAFAVWEPFTMGVLLQYAGELSGAAWGVGLLAPFLALLLAFRTACNKAVPDNARVAPVLDALGGGIFGAASGAVALGVAILGVGMLPIGASIAGHRALDHEENGSLTAAAGTSLILPVDAIAARLYEILSAGSLSTGSPLWLRRPGMELESAGMRASADGVARLTVKPDDIEILSSYSVKGAVDDLLGDRFNESGKAFVYTDGNAPTQGTTLVGYVLNIGSGAKEKDGRVLLGAAQTRLVCETADGKGIGIHPVAAVIKGSAAPPRAGRFRFDSEGIYFSSFASDPELRIALEFLLPKDAKPLDLLCKGVRMAAPESEQHLTREQRDDGVDDMTLLGLDAYTPQQRAAYAVQQRRKETQRQLERTLRKPLPTQKAREAAMAASAQAIRRGEPVDGTDNGAVRQAGVSRSNSIPSAPQIHAQYAGALTIRDKAVAGGQHTFTLSALAGNKVGKLGVKGFAVPNDGSKMVQVDVSVDSPLTLVGRVLNAAASLQQPTIKDRFGNEYPAVGFVFRDNTEIEIRYTPDRPLRSFKEIDHHPSASRPNDRLVLLFLVPQGTEITEVQVLNETVLSFEPGMPTPLGR